MPADPNLEALIVRAQDGDVAAFEVVITAHLPALRRFARGFASSEADAADLAQEALLKAYLSIRGYRFQAAFSTWLYTIARNVCVDQLRSKGGRMRAAEEPLDGYEPAGESPDDLFARAEERERTWRAVGEVPAPFRAVLLLVDVEGLSYDEVAAIERVPVGTIRSRLARGRRALREILEAEAEGETGNQSRIGSVSPMGRVERT